VIKPASIAKMAVVNPVFDKAENLMSSPRLTMYVHWIANMRGSYPSKSQFYEFRDTDAMGRHSDESPMARKEKAARLYA
jgi:hypothetical protein